MLPVNLRSRVIRGTLWTVAFRWLIRLVGLINVAILARLLDPEDFGLVAMAMLVVGLIETWMALGVESALIQNSSATREDFDTAWTLRLIQSVAMAGLVILVSPLAAAWFNEPRLPPLLFVLAGAVIISGCSNIGPVMFSKELQFRKEFWTQLLPKLISFPIAVSAALVLQSYWALAVAIVGMYAAACVISYLIHSYRPRLSLARWRQLWSFSRWLIVINLIAYGERKSDEIIVGGHAGPATLGHYTVASEFGQMPSAEVAAPINKVLYPAFSKLQAEPGALAYAYANALAMVATFTIPAGIGMALVATEAVELILGWKWTAAIPFLVVLALYGTVRSLASSAGFVLLAIGRPKLDAATAGAALLTFLSGAVIAFTTGFGVLGVAVAKLVSAFVAVAVAWTFLVRLTQVTARMIVRSIRRPVLATAVMALVVVALPATGLGMPVDFLLKISTGVITYTVILLSLWSAAHRPDGPERLVVDAVTRRRRRSTGPAGVPAEPRTGSE
jgi:lipopolysaccharide exporter